VLAPEAPCSPAASITKLNSLRLMLGISTSPGTTAREVLVMDGVDVYLFSLPERYLQASLERLGCVREAPLPPPRARPLRWRKRR